MAFNQVFEALAHPVRREILARLRSGPLSAGDLADGFDLTKPSMSVHFKKLREADLVSVERQGTSLIYQLNMSLLEEALAGVLTLTDGRGAADGGTSTKGKHE
ncbi:metalloregulator ArsR/SmtB family transcription factor [Pannonibacter carbonis]|uniref:metalloregulator ArsR/SmtB family transcription factor n=1 Tax=Pannonibacter carbonis TaxID=2067569 RepID=UPI000D114E62|nr:metalloregulator ArsR/SmtB family transcription factor [Pannonibacter carbonis]